MLLHQLLGNGFQQVGQSPLTKQRSCEEAAAQEAACVVTVLEPLSKGSLSLATSLLSPFGGLKYLCLLSDICKLVSVLQAGSLCTEGLPRCLYVDYLGHSF